MALRWLVIGIGIATGRAVLFSALHSFLKVGSNVKWQWNLALELLPLVTQPEFDSQHSQYPFKMMSQTDAGRLPDLGYMCEKTLPFF